MKLTSRNKAFTLIELLVVIAIIGILAAVVIASLNSARTKGKYAAIKSNLRNAVSQAAIYHANNGTYTGLCDDSTIQSIISALGGAGSAACYVSASSTLFDLEFGIAATFDGTHFVADTSGVLQLDAANIAGSHTWDAGMAACGAAGKRMPSLSALRSLWGVTNSTPSGLNASNYWSSTEYPLNTTQAYRINFADGTIGNFDKTTPPRFVRCGS